MSELITTSSAYIINGDSPMTSVANTVAMTTLAVHTLQPLIFYIPTLDMYLPLSKFESIHRVYIALRCNHN